MNRPVRLGIVMDAIESLKIAKDSSFAMLLAAQARGWSLEYMQLGDLYLRDGVAEADAASAAVRDNPGDWFSLGARERIELGDLDVILMRKDPPFNMEYVYATYVLERAQAAGSLVVNRPSTLRDANEKLYTAWFGQCCPPTLVARRIAELKEFQRQYENIVVKPLDGMGGASVFKIAKGDPNTSVILETLTDHEQRFIMAQKYIPEISRGDKRILLVDGEPIPYALARIPAAGETRGNLAAGATGKGVPLSERDRWICAQVGPTLREKGLLFVGLDVIGDYLTEVNVTSPTCIRELDQLYGLDIAGDLLNVIENRLANHETSV